MRVAYHYAIVCDNTDSIPSYYVIRCGKVEGRLATIVCMKYQYMATHVASVSTRALARLAISHAVRIGGVINDHFSITRCSDNAHSDSRASRRRRRALRRSPWRFLSL